MSVQIASSSGKLLFAFINAIFDVSAKIFAESFSSKSGIGVSRKILIFHFVECFARELSYLF